jgi:hypothetical protein
MQLFMYWAACHSGAVKAVHRVGFVWSFCRVAVLFWATVAQDAVTAGHCDSILLMAD